MPTMRQLNSRCCAIAGVALTIATVPASAQENQPTTQAALLFAYQPHDGMETRFHEGYRRHLDWHRNAGDTLIWYGWEVIAGNRLGVFIDGTFGRPFRAMDVRVDPAGDAADFATNAGEYADPLFRTAYVLRSDLSTATPLERGEPTPTVEAITYHLQPGQAQRFDVLLRTARESARERDRIPPFTWYELVNGDTHPSYLLLIHGRGLSGWDRARADLASLLGAIPDRAQRERQLAEMAATVSRVSSELWRYLPESSLIPEE